MSILDSITLGGALDQNRNGSALDDILGSLGRTFGRS